MSILPVGEVCQVATMLLKTIRAVGESARNHKEALPRILMLEGTLKQLTEVEAREQKTLSHKKHHVEQANALESLQSLCEQLEIQVGKAKKIANKIRISSTSCLCNKAILSHAIALLSNGRRCSSLASRQQDHRILHHSEMATSLA